MKASLLLTALFLFFAGCQKSEIKTPSYNEGELTIVTDESFKSVTEALAEGYMISYPETKLKVVTQKEDLAFLDLLNGKAKIIVMSRDLSEKEKEAFKNKIDLELLPARFAVDAVVFIVPKSSKIEKLSMDQINQGLESDEKPFIFDGTNSSNLNFIAQKLGKSPSDLKFNIISGNENVAKQLSRHPDKIGVISLNTISRPYGKDATSLRSMIRILPVEDKGQLYEPNIENLREMKYPFSRVLYFLTSEANFNLANGFIRYSCTQLGQMIVQKEGLQKYNLYQREVQMR
ncbi:PstS family phosphate ABC transporter substrate-binding protein [Chryseobacterium koreense]|uniref:Phosphate ABC transporter substrate-binding protein n=1 Tax=Chryseobacterium koreense CCUG 49689 TaxID=1304281 RepID=A0A0J7IVL2_9FLAO|nr:substrate-binding domain-containing protein [Chryseobacterium koreense]KMQ70338.1 phosphate ABC transporter substrate-binding protein [Chryseobacterium koreense CCUG 49689]MBB5334636.1 phosphate transport system substrate-binding protein [Chryseobacterium koreense]